MKILLIALVLCGELFPQSYKWKEKHSVKQDSVYFVSDSVGYIPGRTINKTTDGGNNWVQYDTGFDNNLNAMFFIGPYKGWAVGAAGIILYTNDGGQSWTEQEKGLTNNFNSVYFVDDKTGWAVGDGGSMFKTNDSGAHWQKVDSGVNTNLFKVFFIDSNEGFALGIGVTLKTTNGGNDWNIVRSKSAFSPNTIYFDKEKGWQQVK